MGKKRDRERALSRLVVRDRSFNISSIETLVSSRESDRLSLSLSLSVYVCKTSLVGSDQLAILSLFLLQDEPRETAARPLLVVLYFLVRAPHTHIQTHTYSPLFFPHPFVVEGSDIYFPAVYFLPSRQPDPRTGHGLLDEEDFDARG